MDSNDQKVQKKVVMYIMNRTVIEWTSRVRKLL